jgi:RimJ/RimL family protein N-acetyltransferase
VFAGPVLTRVEFSGRDRLKESQKPRKDGAVSQPTLRTERLRLVPLSDDHLEDEVELDSDPAVMRYLGAGQGRTREEVEELHGPRRDLARQNPGQGFWVGFADGSFVGTWALGPPERDNQGPADGQAELAYRLLRRYWRRGLASEGSRELLRYGFEDLGLSRIFAETMAVNAGSRATMTTIGMTYVRTFHQELEVMLPGSELGEVEYAITREEWLSRR